MNGKKLLLAGLAMLCCGALAAAAPVTVAFIDGTVQVLSGGSWKALDFGDRFDSSQSVKLEKGAILELSTQSGSTVTISAAGTYVVDALLKPRTESGAVATVAAKLEKLAKGTASTGTVAGVRGNPAASAGGLMWSGAGVDAEAAFEEAKAAMEAGTYTIAWDRFMEALALYGEAEDANGAARSAWHASLAGIAAGSGARALAALRAASPDDAGALRGSYALALATLNARYGATAEAKALLERATAAGWFDDPAMAADAASLLSGL